MRPSAIASSTLRSGGMQDVAGAVVTVHAVHRADLAGGPAAVDGCGWEVYTLAAPVSGSTARTQGIFCLSASLAIYSTLPATCQ